MNQKHRSQIHPYKNNQLPVINDEDYEIEIVLNQNQNNGSFEQNRLKILQSTEEEFNGVVPLRDECVKLCKNVNDVNMEIIKLFEYQKKMQRKIKILDQQQQILIKDVKQFAGKLKNYEESKCSKNNNQLKKNKGSINNDKTCCF